MSVLWKKLIRPSAFRLDAERVHEMGLHALRSGLARPYYTDPNRFKEMECERFGLKFVNPLGVAAGFDKNGLVSEQLASLGFGFVEVGTVTFRPQKGNPKPRLFRLPADNALINRLGFNNDGADVVAARLRSGKRRCIIGVNIGRNKEVPNEEALENYLSSLEIVHPVADYVAVNISSPNTPDLRELQKGENLDELLGGLQVRNRELGRKPLLVKIAPDLFDDEIESVVDVCLRHNIDGIIATNTTISRAGLSSSDVEKFGSGGLSGKPLFSRSNEVIAKIYRASQGKVPIVGVGGVFSAEDAFKKIELGASLIQVYTGFIYGGPTFPADVSKGLVSILKERGFRSVDEAVGSRVK